MKRLTQERDALQRQVSHKRPSESGGGGAAASEVAEQLEYYRSM